ncbi:hypothetical protein D3C80_1887690 [compost metagenome]
MSRLLWPSSLRRLICGNGLGGVAAGGTPTGDAGPADWSAMAERLDRASPRDNRYLFITTSSAVREGRVFGQSDSHRLDFHGNLKFP